MADAGRRGGTKTGERIAKVLARAGVASRREAEAMIAAGRVAVNGKVIDSPALDIGPGDRVTLDGRPLAAPEPPRLWLYHKPEGLVTTERDEKGRATVFASLPEGIPRVVSVGRLDIASEGLLLLTNDGELKRRLELPSTGWLRRYRVRVNGTPSEESVEPLRRGITVEGERFQPMTVTIDRQQGANAWLTVGIREGRNREVRRAMEAVGLVVNRLIRIGYGPFQLGDLAAGEVREVPARTLRDQLGIEVPIEGGHGATAAAGRVTRRRPAAAAAADGGDGGESAGGGEGDGQPAASPRATAARARTARAAAIARRSGEAQGPDAADPAAALPRAGDARPPRPRHAPAAAPRRPRAARPDRAGGAEGEAPRKPRSPRPARAEGGEARPPRGGPRTPRQEGEAPRKPRFPRAGHAEGEAPRKPSFPRAGHAEGGEARPPRGGPRTPRQEGEAPRTLRFPRADRAEGEAPRTPRFPRAGGSGEEAPRPARDAGAAGASDTPDAAARPARSGTAGGVRPPKPTDRPRGPTARRPAQGGDRAGPAAPAAAGGSDARPPRPTAAPSGPRRRDDLGPWPTAARGDADGGPRRRPPTRPERAPRAPTPPAGGTPARRGPPAGGGKPPRGGKPGPGRPGGAGGGKPPRRS